MLNRNEACLMDLLSRKNKGSGSSSTSCATEQLSWELMGLHLQQCVRLFLIRPWRHTPGDEQLVSIQPKKSHLLPLEPLHQNTWKHTAWHRMPVALTAGQLGDVLAASTRCPTRSLQMTNHHNHVNTSKTAVMDVPQSERATQCDGYSGCVLYANISCRRRLLLSGWVLNAYVGCCKSVLLLQWLFHWAQGLCASCYWVSEVLKSRPSGCVLGAQNIIVIDSIPNYLMSHWHVRKHLHFGCTFSTILMPLAHW